MSGCSHRRVLEFPARGADVKPMAALSGGYLQITARVRDSSRSIGTTPTMSPRVRKLDETGNATGGDLEGPVPVDTPRLPSGSMNPNSHDGLPANNVGRISMQAHRQVVSGSGLGDGQDCAVHLEPIQTGRVHSQCVDVR